MNKADNTKEDKKTISFRADKEYVDCLLKIDKAVGLKENQTEALKYAILYTSKNLEKEVQLNLMRQSLVDNLVELKSQAKIINTTIENDEFKINEILLKNIELKEALLKSEIANEKLAAKVEDLQKSVKLILELMIEQKTK